MSSHFFPRDEYFMRLALREATRALEHDDVPIGAVIVQDGEVIGTGHNERELRADPTAHAEMIALREAARALGGWRVLEAVHVRDARAVRHVRRRDRPGPGAAGGVRRRRTQRRAPAGACWTSSASRSLNHRPQVESGLLAEESAEMLRAFFAERR